MTERRIQLPQLGALLAAAWTAREGHDEATLTSRLISALLEDGLRERASDIHLDPVPDGCWIRFRIDGSIVDVLRFEKENADKLIRALKTQAGIHHGSNPTPQDGRGDFVVGARTCPIRIATAPCIGGEKIAIRFLPTQAVNFLVKQLGLRAPDLVEVLRGLQDSTGMVLISGPTGSGKTTTAYALLRELMTTARSVATVEDPVEFQLDGLAQLQINQRQGLSFSEAIAGLLRLDPDVIMLGEIRAAASARAALTAADGGHLFISTLHARDAAGTITALRNYGLGDPEIAANLNMIVAQRLVRRLCLGCCHRDPLTREEIRWLKALHFTVPKHVWRPVGCSQCSMTGYHGRVGIFEVVRLGETETDLILKHADEPTLRRHFRKSGTHSLVQDDLQKAADGVTSLSETYYITGLAAPPPPPTHHRTLAAARTATAIQGAASAPPSSEPRNGKPASPGQPDPPTRLNPALATQSKNRF